MPRDSPSPDADLDGSLRSACAYEPEMTRFSRFSPHFGDDRHFDGFGA
jgi:hypothetical protein